MSSTDKQGSSLGSFRPSPPLYPHFNWPSGFWPCVKSCLVGGSDKYMHAPGFLAGPSGIRAGWCSKPRADSGPNRPPASAGQPSGGRAALLSLCTALDQASSLSRKLAYVPGPIFGFVKLLASSGSHCTKWADEQHRQAGFESRLLPDLPLPFIPTLIGLRAFDLVSSRVWWEAATNTMSFVPDGCSKPRADSWPNRPPASAGQPSGGRAALLSPLYGTRTSV